MQEYRKIKSIGKGTFGSVNLVERTSDQKCLAMKKIYLSLDNDQSPPTNEILILQSLDHPNIIKYYESFIQDNKLYIVTDYASHGNFNFILFIKGDLAQLIKNHAKNEKPIAEEYIFKCCQQIVSALVYLQEKKIIHRDLKTQNIFLDSKENIKLGDFGISKQLTDSNEHAKTSLGTPYYLSPEICKNEPYDHKTDIWMLGCVLYEMLTFKKPFQGESLNSIINNILYGELAPIPSHYSPFLFDIVKGLLEKNPAKRFNAAELRTYMMKITTYSIQAKQSFFPNVPLNTPTTNESEIKKKKVQISIVTQNLNTNNQQFRPVSDKQGILQLLEDEFSETRPKSFSFGKTIFNNQTPTSPQRQILFQEFLKKRLGESKYAQAMDLITKAKNPIEFLDQSQNELLSLIGQENKETLKCFKMLLLQPKEPNVKRFNFQNYKN